MFKPLSVDELTRMFNAGHVWTCAECGRGVSKSGICVSCGITNFDAHIAYAATYPSLAAKRRQSRAAAKARKAVEDDPVEAPLLDGQRSKQSGPSDQDAGKLAGKSPPISSCPNCASPLMKNHPCITCALNMREADMKRKQLEKRMQENSMQLARRLQLENAARKVIPVPAPPKNESKAHPQESHPTVSALPDPEKTELGFIIIMGGIVIFSLWIVISFFSFILQKPEVVPQSNVIDRTSRELVSPIVSRLELEQEGARHGSSFANELRKIGEKADKTACALGMAAAAERKRHLSQTEVETYAAAFGNACMGQKIL